MNSLSRRIARLSLVSLLAISVAANAQTVQTAPQSATVAAPQSSGTPWLFQGSDIPPDPAWTFGVLPNGVRYAVRRNGVPPGQVSIRVRVDAGSLMERESELGYAHLLEHLAFRGSEHVPDGESKRVWQRLGVTFGSDSNAATTPTNTVYKLDLPTATDQGLDESMKIVAGMLEAPSITTAALNAERPVVLAEQREQPGPQMRFGEALRGLFFAGQPLAERSPIGNIETLEAATEQSVRAFHQRWYRPDRTVVVIAGDKDAKLLEQMVVKHFSDWKPNGAATPTPDFGDPDQSQPTTVATAEASLPPAVSFAYLRPWSITADTILFNQERLTDLLASRIVNRRLESRARAGGSFLRAGVSLDDISRSTNLTSVSVYPLGDDWEAALKDVRAVIADATTRAPSQAEIDRELAEIENAMKQGVATAPVEPGARLADTMVEAVDINETVASAQVSYDIFNDARTKGMFSPARVLASSKKIFDGAALRGIVNTRTPDNSATAKLGAALKAEVSGSEALANADPVSIDDLPPLGTPGTITARQPVLSNPEINIEAMRLSNGVSVLMFPNDAETNRVYVRVRFGSGLKGLPAKEQTVAWAGPMALMQSGIGDLDQEKLDRLVGNRNIGLSFSPDDDAWILGGQTTAADLPDQLRLLAAKLTHPRWDANPVVRARAEMLAGYAAMEASPDGILARDLEGLLRDGDLRWATPSRAAVEALDPASFRAFWEPILKTGPIEVQIFGDVESEAAAQAVAATFGALPPRAPASAAGSPVAAATPNETPVVRRHTGQPNQAAAVIAWPTGGGSAGLAESRKLEVLAAVFRDRVLDELRERTGTSYSPTVLSQWPVGLDSGGRILALASVAPDQTKFFFEAARKIAADLVATPITPDELQRAVLPTVQQTMRMSSGNSFWMQQTAGGTRDPARIQAVTTLVPDYQRTTPAEIQALAAKYLGADKDWSMVVLPEKGAE